MEKECIKYPELNHGDCSLDPYEKVVADYFESRSISITRLCDEWLPKGEKSPDFRITSKDFSCLCEVKFLSSSTGAPTESEWKYANREEWKYIKDEAEKRNAIICAPPSKQKRWREEIPYPHLGRNTEQKEKEFEQELQKRIAK